MKNDLVKLGRFMWRTSRNMICVTPLGRSLLFPRHALSSQFGRGDADYAIRVFLHHYRQLDAAGFHAARRILEVGPGRNLGTSLLMWAFNYGRMGQDIQILLWDVFPNMNVTAAALQQVAAALLQSGEFSALCQAVNQQGFAAVITSISNGGLVPHIRYAVQPLAEFSAAIGAARYDLIYSQAAIEHIWDIATFWSTIIELTEIGGWHTHRIDLADHGRRNTNYVEMLEWSPIAYWVMMRYVPGAINRWRASMHLNFIQQAGMKIAYQHEEQRPELPVPHARLHAAFSNLADADLRTTALDLVAVKIRN